MAYENLLQQKQFVQAFPQSVLMSMSGIEVFGPCGVLSVDRKLVVATTYVFNKPFTSEDILMQELVLMRVYQRGCWSQNVTLSLDYLLNEY